MNDLQLLLFEWTKRYYEHARHIGKKYPSVSITEHSSSYHKFHVLYAIIEDAGLADEYHAWLYAQTERR